MSFLDRLFRRKRERQQPLEWTLDDEGRLQKDYIGSSEYLVPAAASMDRFLREADSGAFIGNDIFFRIDGVEKPGEWARLRDYGFHNLVFRRAGDDYVLEGDGLFMKKNIYGSKEYLTTTECCIFARVAYADRTIRLTDCRGFSESDPWYAFVLLFKLMEGHDKSMPSVSLEKEESRIQDIVSLIADKEKKLDEKKLNEKKLNEKNWEKNRAD